MLLSFCLPLPGALEQVRRGPITESNAGILAQAQYHDICGDVISQVGTI